MTAFNEVSAAEAIAEVEAGTVLIDVREQDEWDRGHAPTAILLPMSNLSQGLDSVPSGQRVLVVCHLGSRSARVTRSLLDSGYDAVNVAGGMVGWSHAGGDLVADGDVEPSVE
ncbi:rhodanese-like domain-containing protein [soil metagenome]